MALWEEDATVVQLPRARTSDDPTLKFEGTLADAFRFLRTLDRDERGRYRISLPNASAQPRSFDGAALLELLAASALALGR